jgi:hypothetical protein
MQQSVIIENIYNIIIVFIISAAKPVKLYFN